MKKFLTDFKKFATKGNVVDMAIAVVIGGAFGKIVTSLVNDVIMPLITLIVGGKSVSSWKWVIKEAVYVDGVLLHAENAIRYGTFLQAILDFLIIAFFIFLALRIILKAKSGFAELSGDFAKANNKERKNYIKQLKVQGKTKAEIKIAIVAYEEKLAAEAKALADAKKLEEEAAKPESTEKILADIRTLLSEKDNNATKS